MAAGSLLTQWTPTDLFRETPVGYNPGYNAALYQTANGASRALRLNKFVIASQLYEYYNGMWFLPTLVALGTGLTFKFFLTDDGTAASDLGLVARIEVTPFNLSKTGALVDWSVGAGTVTTANVTLSATSGNIVIGSVAIVVANLNSLAAGSILGMRLRRVGDNAADTCANSILCYGGEINDT